MWLKPYRETNPGFSASWKTMRSSTRTSADARAYIEKRIRNDKVGGHARQDALATAGGTPALQSARRCLAGQHERGRSRLRGRGLDSVRDDAYKGKWPGFKLRR